MPGGRYSLVALGKRLEVGQEGRKVCFFCTEEEFEKAWSPYFDLDTDYSRFKEAIDPEDGYLQAAARCGGGIRILRQELWETVVTFILSQRNNILRIQKCVDTLCREFGEKRQDSQGKEFSLFPTAEALAGASEKHLRECGLGYRAPYVWKTAHMACDGFFTPELYAMDYRAAKKELMKLSGVGEKVADCISLFALHHIEAFPVDTHIQDMLGHYPEGFPFGRYQGFAGILQQYAFYYEVNG